MRSILPKPIKRMKIYCDIIKKEVLFKFFTSTYYEDLIHVYCEKDYGDPYNPPTYCYDEVECPRRFRYWFDGLPANEKQQKMLKDFRMKGCTYYEEKMEEWFDKQKKRVFDEETILTLKFHKTQGFQ